MTIDERKLPRKNPIFSILGMYLRELRAWCLEFGLTPSSRCRIDIDELKDVESEWDKLLSPFN